jgi:hypothetical protein
VKYHSGAVVNRIHVAAGKISGMSYRMEGAQQDLDAQADYYLLAVPVERAAGLVSKEMLAADPSLRNIVRLAPNVEWMNGIQFYLNTPLNMHRGHTIYSGSNWALTSISQTQFWPHYDLTHRGNGKIVSILSVDISDWENEGDFNKKQARHCTHEEIKLEVWAQLKQELNAGGKDVLRDAMLESSYLDSSIVSAHEAMGEAMLADLTLDEQDKLNKVFNLEPLLVNQVNTWNIRPQAVTRIPNLFLASDYVKTHTDLATMEGANEAARRAVNGILKASGSKDNLCGVWKLETPWLLRALRVADAAVFTAQKFWRGLIQSVAASKP